MKKTRVLWNVDGTINAQGPLEYYVDICMRTGVPETGNEYSDETATKQ